MTSVKCKCGSKFEKECLEQSYTLTFACPHCKPNKWKLTKFSGIKWKVFPRLKDLLCLKEENG